MSGKKKKTPDPDLKKKKPASSAAKKKAPAKRGRPPGSGSKKEKKPVEVRGSIRKKPAPKKKAPAKRGRPRKDDPRYDPSRPKAHVTIPKPRGRPPLFDNCLDLAFFIELYFEDCEEKKQIPTFTGLSLAIDMDRHTLNNYSKKDDFFSTIKKARLKVQSFWESGLNGPHAAGKIFNLINNSDYSNKTESVLTVKNRRFDLNFHNFQSSEKDDPGK